MQNNLLLLENSSKIQEKFQNVFLDGNFECCVADIKTKTLLTEVYIDVMGSNKVATEQDLCREMLKANEIINSYLK